MTIPSPRFGLKGSVTVEVINGGVVIGQPVTTKNLWLDQGLNNWATTALCDLFNTAAKGTGTTPTTEDLTGSSNTYSITNGGTTITRTAGSRNFTSGDVGKLIVFADNQQFYITALTDTTHVVVSPAATSAESAQKIIIYSVNQVGLDSENGRTQTYSSASGDNGTTTPANSAVRTFKRTFIFGAENPRIEVVAAANTYTQSGTAVTRQTGTRDFISGDVGSTLTFQTVGFSGVIQSVGSTSTVTLSTSNTVTTPDTIKLSSDAGLTTNTASTYSRSGSTVTRVSGAYSFTSNDVGKIIHFATSNVEAFITAFTDATHVTVDTSGTLPAQSATLYGFTSYTEIGFASTMDRGNNLNVRVLLSAPVVANIGTPLRASDQLKITYQAQLTVSPASSTSGDLSTVIADPGNALSSNKAGNYAIETYATSIVLANGQTDTSTPDLEPYYAGTCAFSTNTDAIAPLSGKVRSNTVQTTPFTAESYAPQSFNLNYDAVFGLNDANGNWRSLMLYAPGSALSIFCFLFTVNQVKDSNHTLSLIFNKAWGRDLS